MGFLHRNGNPFEFVLVEVVPAGSMSADVRCEEATKVRGKGGGRLRKMGGCDVGLPFEVGQCEGLLSVFCNKNLLVCERDLGRCSFEVRISQREDV